MWEFLSNYWPWILVLGGIVVMHLGHGHGHAGREGKGRHGGYRSQDPYAPQGATETDSETRHRDHGCH